MQHRAAIYPSLKDRAVLAMGGATGIGAALVEAFCAQNARVFFIDLQEAVSRALVERIAMSGHARPSFHVVNAGRT